MSYRTEDKLLFAFTTLCWLIVVIALAYKYSVQREQNKQLIKIVERCGAELVVDKDGNYDAIMPLTKEEVQAMWDAMIKDIERRKKQ